MMVRENIIQENRVRRTAKRRGFILKRSRRRDPKALDYGRYWLLDDRNREVFPKDSRGALLDDVEEWMS